MNSKTTTRTSRLEEALSAAQLALLLMAYPVRPDGTYKMDRRDCEILAKTTLDKIKKILGSE